MIFTGLSMTGMFKNCASQPRKINARKIHRILAPFMFLPLTVSAVTGVIYRLGKSWFGKTKGIAKRKNIFSNSNFIPSLKSGILKSAASYMKNIARAVNGIPIQK